MNWTIISRYGLYAASVLIAMGLLSFAFLGSSPENYGIGEVIGYSSIVFSLLFVYFGIKNYRDRQLNGCIDFWNALKTGLLITLFPALAFAIYNYIFVEFIDPDFMDTYYEHHLAEMKENLSTEEFLTAKAQLESEKEIFMNTGLNVLIMFLTVWLIGLIVSILSAILLQNTPKKATT